MKEKYIPAELKTRRDKVLSLYESNYCEIDIARIFEVTTSSVRKSLEAAGISDINEKNNSEALIDISDRLKERDVFLKSKGGDDSSVWYLGFWRVPKEFGKVANSTDNKISIESELRAIGIQPKEIREYLEYDEERKLEASRPQKNEFFDEQIMVCEALYARGWSIQQMIEFTGISVGRFVHRHKEKTKTTEGLMKGYERIKDLAEILFNEYNDDNNDSVTHQQLAKKYGITRRSVITYIQQYELKTGKKSKKKTSIGNRKKGEEKEYESFDVEKLKEIMVLNENKKWEFKGDWTIEKAGHEFNVSELTIAKYKRKLNED